jgi:hypothetical protein
MLRVLVKGTVLVALLYAGAILGFPYFQYVMMQQAVEEAADTGLAQLKAMGKGPGSYDVFLEQVTRTITNLVQEKAKQVGLELPAKGIRVSLEPDLFRVGTTWVAEARLPGYVHRYHFRVEGKRIVVR